MNKDFEMYIGKRVWCKSEKLAKEFLQLAHDNGWEWITGVSLLNETNWNYNKENTCYQIYEDKKIAFGTINDGEETIAFISQKEKNNE